MNRAWPKPSTGVSGFTAADHLICPPVTQAWDRPRNPRPAEPLGSDLNFLRNFDLKNPNYKVIANNRGLYHELDHRRLVDECRSVFNAGGVLWRRLVQTAR
jgi:hypothetical protein